MREAVSGFTILLMLLLVGCTHPTPSGQPGIGPPAVSPIPGTAASTNQTGLIVTPSMAVTGKIVLVNPNARYVVVNYPLGSLPLVGRTLNVYRRGLKVGEIKITGPQRDLNTVADIVAGECQAGDEVRTD